MASANEVSGLTGSVRSSYNTLLKIMYGDKLGDHLLKAGPFAEVVQGGASKPMGGSKYMGAAVTGFPQGNFTMREGQPFQTFGTGTSVNPEYFSRNDYTGVQLTGNVIRAAKAGNEAAFANALTLELETVKKTAAINRERKCILGQADILSVTLSWAAGPPGVATLHSRNERTSSGVAFWYSGVAYHRVGQFVGPTTSALGAPTYTVETVANERQIGSIGGTNAAPTFTFSGSTTVVSGTPADATMWIPHHNRALTGYSAAADDITLFSGHFGLMSAVVDANGPYTAFAGLAKSTTPGIGGVYRTNSGTPRTYEEKLVRVLAANIQENPYQSNEPMTDVLCHSGIMREMLNEIDGLKRYNPVSGEQGFTAPMIRLGDYAVPVKTSHQMIPGCVVGVRKQTWGKLQESSMQPLDPSIGNGARFVAGYDQQQIIMHESFNIECISPGANGMLDDIDYDVFDVNT